MRTHLPRIAVAAILLVAVGILALVHQSYRGGFASGVTVTVETGRAGLVL
ncbi:Mce family protein, partial [Rhodococcus sp. CX]|nr:Mce family protein [Rhodococcus sp. CX]